VRQELVQAIQGTPSPAGSEEHAQHNGPWSDGPLGWPYLINRLAQADLVRLGLHKGQMLDRGRFDGR
jgi:hypothetical protein